MLKRTLRCDESFSIVVALKRRSSISKSKEANVTCRNEIGVYVARAGRRIEWLEKLYARRVRGLKEEMQRIRLYKLFTFTTMLTYV